MTEPRQHNAISGTVHGPAVQARDIGTIVIAPTRAVRVPHQLPISGGRVWVNRAAELAQLDDLFAQPGTQRVVLTGMGGVGKTATAVRWLTQQQAARPDGELYADLGGWSGRPTPPPERTLAAWLRALGMPADDIPHELTELAALYRTAMADRAMLILADNAHTADQIRPLLPGSSPSVLLVTSRHRLPGLIIDGFQHVELDCLSTQDAATMLAGLLPNHHPDHTGALHALAHRCRGLPLALAIAGGHLTIRRHSPAALVTRLDADPRRTFDLSLGEMSVGAVLNTSYADLDAPHAQLLRLSALHPGPEFTAGPLAPAWGRAESDTDLALATLAEANLLTETSERRFRLHDLIRDHVQELVKQHDPVGYRNIALRKMITWYLHRTAHADRALNTFAPRFTTVFDLVTTTSAFTTPAEAMAWFESERSTILQAQELAAEHGWDDLVYQLAEALWNPVRPNYAADELYRTQQLGAEAAHRARHVVEGACLLRVAFAETNRGHHEAATAAATAAFDHGTTSGHAWTQSAALSMRARAHLAADDPRAALADIDRSMEIEQTLDDPERGIALRERIRGQSYAHPAIADYSKAVEHFQIALTLMRRIGDEVGYARVAIDLAVPLLRTDRAAAALVELEQVTATVRAYGSAGYLADLCTVLAQVHAQLGHLPEAHAWCAEALQFYQAAGPGAARRRDTVAALSDALPATVHSDQSDMSRN